MSDQGRWFKLWVTADDDPELDNLGVAGFGQWCRFGLYLKKHGRDGTITLAPPCRTLQVRFEVNSFEAVLAIIRGFPNCTVTPVTSVTEAAVTSSRVVWRNWRKFQVESSNDRVRRWREQQRDDCHGPRALRGVTGHADVTPTVTMDVTALEEKRGEETRREDLPPVVPPPSGGTPPWIAKLPFPSLPREWWSQTLAVFPGVDHEAVLREAAAYWLGEKGRYRQTARGVQRFIRHQLARAHARARERGAEADTFSRRFPHLWECRTCGGAHPGTPEGPGPCPKPPAAGEEGRG